MKNIKKFMAMETKSKAQIINDRIIEVTTFDGECFSILSNLSKYESEEYRNYYLHLIEFIFDQNFNEDKETMIKRIYREFIINAVPSMGIDGGSREKERIRIGKRIKELREAKRMEAKDLAILAGIDAANLSRIEQGKYSTGIEILSRIALILDAHVDIVPNSSK